MWKDIPGFEKYEVNELGEVRRKAWILKPGSIPSGHLTVALSTGTGKPKSVYVHRLVAEAFLENVGNKRVVNHKNGNPKDNSVGNLEWATHSENNFHAYRQNGKRVSTEKRLAAITKDGDWVISFRSGADAARYFNVTTGAITSAARRKGSCSGYRWVHVNG